MIDKLLARPRRRVVTSAASAALAVLAASAVSACSSGSPAAPPPPPAPSAPKHAPNALRGTVTAENGNTWTVNTARGAAYTVDITPTTTFGTKKAPATAQSFPVGTEVVVRGARTGTTVTASQINAPAKPAPASPSASPTPAG